MRSGCRGLDFLPCAFGCLTPIHRPSAPARIHPCCSREQLAAICCGPCDPVPQAVLEEAAHWLRHAVAAYGEQALVELSPHPWRARLRLLRKACLCSGRIIRGALPTVQVCCCGEPPVQQRLFNHLSLLAVLYLPARPLPACSTPAVHMQEGLRESRQYKRHYIAGKAVRGLGWKGLGGGLEEGTE